MLIKNIDNTIPHNYNDLKQIKLVNAIDLRYRENNHSQ